MVHEWWGITKHMHDEARRLAGQGYTAFLADMYGDAKTADNPTDADAATALGKKFNLPLRYDAKVNKEAEAEASKFLASVFNR